MKIWFCASPVKYNCILPEHVIEFAVGKLDVKQRVLEGNDLLSPLAVQGDGNLGHSIFSSSVSRG